MKRISLEELLKAHRKEPYEEQYRYLLHLLDSGKIKPLKASGINGKKPALYLEYWLLEDKKDYSALEEELKYHLAPGISVDYYLANLKVYEKDRHWVLMLSDYLKTKRELLERKESLNERSFEIWSREKFLQKEEGKRVLKRCGIGLDALNIYETAEPLSCYTHTRETPQNLLILENKDTFYSMRMHLLEGNTEILGMRTGTLIYGAGKGIWKSFYDFDFCVEPYMKADGNQIFYFGDLDYEGIGIYEKLAEMCSCRILPFVPAYEAMLRKAGDTKKLPGMKELQNRNITGEFWSYFEKDTTEKMQAILKSGAYIPQEILNISDFAESQQKREKVCNMNF